SLACFSDRRRGYRSAPGDASPPSRRASSSPQPSPPLPRRRGSRMVPSPLPTLEDPCDEVLAHVRGHSIAVSEEVAAFHREAFVFDLHNDLLTKLTHFGGDIAKEHGPAALWNPLRLDLDLPRIRRGGLDALGCLLFAGFRFDRRHRRFWRQLD